MRDCPHRKETYRLQQCPSCRGNVQVKVFECDKFGECSVGKAIEGIHRCDYRPPKPAQPDRQKVVQQRKPRAQEVAAKPADGQVVLNTNLDGAGAAVLMAWISEGNKNLIHYATGGKKVLLELLGQTVVKRQAEMADTWRASDREEDRPQFYAKYIGFNSQPQRPRHNLTADEIEAAPHGKILLCPDADYPSRGWPPGLWVDLANKLPADQILFCSNSVEPRYNDLPRAQWKDWRQRAATILNAKLVIGVDGAAVHLAGTLGVRCYAILNAGVPASTFSLYDSVTPIGKPGIFTTHWRDVLEACDGLV